jgi:ribonuclease III
VLGLLRKIFSSSIGLEVEELDKERLRDLQTLQKHLGIDIKNMSLLNKSLCHRSQYPHLLSNERLEFLGDSILGAVITSYLYKRYPQASEGDLTKMKSYLVSEQILAKRSKLCDLGRYILLSKSEEQNKGRERQSILADTFEAIVSCIYLEHGFKYTEAFVLKHFEDEFTSMKDTAENFNYKSFLQEYLQKEHHKNPVYKVMEEKGPEHARIYFVEVYLDGESLGGGSGSSRKIAEQNAAAEAISRLKVDIKGLS